MARVLIAESDPETARSVRGALQDHQHRVELVDTGDAAWSALRVGEFDLLLLALDLRNCRGVEVLRRVRRSAQLARLPVIARSTGAEVERVVAFELGADDRIQAPFSLRELSLRVRAVLRRAMPCGGALPASEAVDLGDMVFVPDGRELRVDGRRLRLSPLESRLLTVLSQTPGRVWRREELSQRVWATPPQDERSIDSQIRRLRDKMGKAAARVETVRGVGYRLRVSK